MQISFFAATDTKLHRHLRSRVTAAYSMSSMLSMESLIQDVANQGWAKFRELVARGQPIELDKWVSYFTFDVVGTLALGGPLGMIQQEKDVDGIIGSIHDGFWLMANMGPGDDRFTVKGSLVSVGFIRVERGIAKRARRHRPDIVFVVYDPIVHAYREVAPA